MQPQGLRAQRGQRRTGNPMWGLEVDQHLPRLVQRLGGAVPRGLHRPGTHGIDVCLRGPGRRGHRLPLRAPEPERSACHVDQPGQRPTGEHEKPDAPGREVFGRQPGAGRTGQYEHVGARRPDRQRVAHERRKHGDQADRQHSGPGHLRGPVAERDEYRETDGHTGQKSGTEQVGAVGAVQRGEGADRGQQSGTDVAHGPADCHRQRHAQSGPQCERPPPRTRLEHEELPHGIAVRRWTPRIAARGHGVHTARTTALTPACTRTRTRSRLKPWVMR